MKLLSALTPAETLLLTDAPETDLVDLLKYTMMDLVLKGVLEMKMETRIHPRDPHKQKYFYVSKGSNFDSYQSFKHETIFLTLFQERPTAKISLLYFTRRVYKGAKSESYYKRIITEIPRVSGCFKTSFLQDIFGGFELTVQGEEIVSDIFHELDTIAPKLIGLIESKKENAAAMLTLVKGDASLIQTIDLVCLKKIESKFIYEEERISQSSLETDDGTGYSGDFGDSSSDFD